MLFFKILFKLHDYKDFLKRFSRPGKGQKLLKRPLDRRFVNETRGISLMSREDIIAYFTMTAISQEDRPSFKEELFVPLVLMILWTCEPIYGEQAANKTHGKEAPIDSSEEMWQ